MMNSKGLQLAVGWALMTALSGGMALASEVYRWVDADGTVHFSEAPPPGTDADAMNLRFQSTPDPAAAAARQKAWNDEHQARRDADSAAREQAQAASREAADRQRKCADARAIVERLTDYPATRYQHEDGSYQRYGDDEREEKISAAREAEQAFCY